MYAPGHTLSWSAQSLMGNWMNSLYCLMRALKLLRVRQVLGVLLQVQRDPGPSRQILGIILLDLHMPKPQLSTGEKELLTLPGARYC